ncbi:glycosyltransferase family 4 protein [Erythrobacter sp. SD-21]|uniref:glycosyltransferase family 4 protein n=1 Tax=Erythrobacter sp. SD-21 TaxID=161528 RepID=UPI000153F4BF|nr:glycosyltransferase family 4 protein [Erythrobacter sp. SD-21]EDL49029.1 glycosyl transferase group 1 [Erythrobacter sp. SD-21]
MSAADDGLAPNVLHVLPTRQSAELIAAFGNRLRHTLVTPDGELPAGLRRSPYLKTASEFPPLDGALLPGRLQKLARAMTPFDLVLTHGYEALDVAMAHTLFKDAMNLPPLVHHEHKPDVKPGVKRTWYRRIALGKSAGLVVPGEALEERALVDWQQPMGRVKRIPPAVDTKGFARKPRNDSLRLIKHKGERWIGCWPHAADGPQLAGLVEAMARLDEDWHLVVPGEEGLRSQVEAQVDRLELNDRVHFLEGLANPVKVMGLFDIFVELSPARGFPIHVVEAMAASVPILAPRTHEIEGIVAEANHEWLYDPETWDTLSAYLGALAGDKALRATLGKANRAQTVQAFDRDKVFATCRRLYASAMKREF